MTRDGEIVRWANEHQGIIRSWDLHHLRVSRAVRRRMVGEGLLVEVAPGIYTIGGAPPSWETRLRAAVVQVAPSGAACGASAAAWWDLPSFEPGPIEVCTHRRAAHPAVPIGTVRRLTRWAAGDVVEVDGLRVTNPLRTVTDLSPHVGFGRLDACIQAFARRGLLTIEDLDDRLQRWRRSGTNGVKRTELAIARNVGVDPGDSFLEGAFFRLLREHGIERPETQVEIEVDGRCYRVDGLWRSRRLIVELKGYGTHSTRAEHNYDADREGALVAAGYTLVAFTYDHVVRTPSVVVSRLHRLLDRAA